MLVQQERIDSFYKELRESVASYNSSNPHDKHFDDDFVKIKMTDLSVDYWLKTIGKRMEMDSSDFTNGSPLFSYTSNKCWFELAFDLVKLTTENPDNYIKNWLRVIFPTLSVLRDPITFQSLYDYGSISVYVTQRLPDFDYVAGIQTKFEGVKAQKFAETVQLSFKRFNNNYFYIVPEKRLYYIGPNAEVDEVNIPENRRDEFHLELLPKLVPIHKRHKCNVKGELFVAESDLRHEVSLKDIWRLIIAYGGYPRLDLRSYFISDNRQMLYSSAGFFAPRHKILATGRNYNPKNQHFHIYIDVYPNGKQDYQHYRDVISHVTYDEIGSIAPRPMSIEEFGRLRSMEGDLTYYDGEECFPYIRRFMVKIFLLKWTKMSLQVPSRVYVTLFEVLKEFVRNFPVGTEMENFQRCRKDLNKWSKSVLQDNSCLIINRYKNQIADYFSVEDSARILRFAEVNTSKVFWQLENIRELYKFYSDCTKVSLDGCRIDNYHNFDLLMHASTSKNINSFTIDVDSMLLMLVELFPDKYRELKGLLVSNMQDFNYFKMTNKYVTKLLDDLAEVCDLKYKSEILSISKSMKGLKRDSRIPKRIIDKIVSLYKKYDLDSKKSPSSYTDFRDPVRAKWVYVARILTGLNYFDDYLKLMLPGLYLYQDFVTGEPLSNFDIGHFVLASNGKYLINLNHVRDLYRQTGEVFDCSGPRLRYMNRQEIDRIRSADKKFHSFYEALKQNGSLGVDVKFSFLLAMYRFVTRTLQTPVDPTSKYVIYLHNGPSNPREGTLNTLQCIALDCFEYMFGKIKVILNDTGSNIKVTIDYNDSDKPQVREIINYSELSGHISLPLNSAAINSFKSEIIYILRCKGTLPQEYSEEDSAIIEREYELFYDSYCNLSLQDRNILDGTIISDGNKFAYFKDIIEQLKFSISYAARFFVSTLVAYYPRFVIPMPLFSAHRGLIRASRIIPISYDSAGFKQDIDKIFVSLMTYNFLLPNESLSGFGSIVILDANVRYPHSPYLIKVGNWFREYYVQDDSDAIEKLVIKLFTEIIYPGFDAYFDPERPYYRHGFNIKIHAWFKYILSGVLTSYMPLLESEEVVKIISKVKYKYIATSDELIEKFSLLVDTINTAKLASKIASRAVVNIHLINFIGELESFDFLKLINAIYMNPEITAFSKDILKMYVIAKSNYALSDADIIAEFSNMFDIESRKASSTGLVGIFAKAEDFPETIAELLELMHQACLSLDSSPTLTTVDSFEGAIEF